MGLTTTFSLGLLAELTKTADLSAVPTDELDFSFRTQLSSGTGAGQADQLWYDQRMLAASATEDLDLAGSLANQFGATVTLARVKMLIVRAAAGNTNDVLVGGASATQWASFLGTAGVARIRPGATMSLTAGEADATCYVTAAGSTDLLKVANSAGTTSVTYEIVVIGATA